VRSDVFSLGTVLYFCATGRLPFIGRNPHHLLKLLLEGEYPDPLRLRPSIGAELAQITSKALSRAPDDRYQSAEEMAERLRAFLSEMGIDDPDETLARYLAQPDEVASELEQHALQTLLTLGSEAAKSGRVSKAQSALSRVLALDDGNDRALKLLGTLGRRRRVNLIIALVTTAVVLSLAGAAYLGWRRTQSTPVNAEPTPVAEKGPSDAPSEPAELVEPDPSTSGDEVRSIAEEESRAENRPKEAVPNGRRWVVFKPTPPNVSISVDGSPPKPFGPGFQRVRLKLGNHTFRFVGADNCCEQRVVRKRIPAGARDFELSVTLRYKPARLYLKGPAPPNATVQITLPGNRTVTGQIREILRIPMKTIQSSAQVQIRAPGYRTYRTVVKLRAGADLTEHSFKLERDGETP